MFKKILLFLFLFYSFLGFVLIPLLLKPQLINIIEKQTKTKLSIGSFYLNPYSFTIKLSGIKLKSSKNKPLLFLKYIDINLEPHSLFDKTINIKSVELSNLEIYLEYYSDKSINFSKLLRQTDIQTPKTEEQDNFELPKILLNSFKITDGVINYKDFTSSKVFELSLRNINFSLEDIDTSKYDNSNGKIRIYSRLSDGSELDIHTNILGFKPFKIDGDINFKASQLYTQWKYLQDKVGVEIADGKISLDAKYALNLDDLNSASITKLNLNIQNLRIKPKDKHYDVLNLKSFILKDLSVKPIAQELEIKYISLDEMYVKALKNTQGKINWIEFFKEKKGLVEEKKLSQEKGTDSKPWRVVLNDVKLHKISLDFEDKSIKPKVTTKLNKFNLHLQNVTLLGEKPFSYDASLLLNNKMNCSLKGNIIHKRLNISSYIKCDSFDLVHYNPYINKLAKNNLDIYNIKLRSMELGFDTNLMLNKQNNELFASLKDTNFYINNLSIDKSSTNENLVKFKKFKINNLNLNTKTKKIDIQNITLNSLGINILKDDNNFINLLTLIKAKKSQINKKKNTRAKDKNEYRIKLKNFNLNSAKISFKDKSLEEQAKLSLDKIYLKASNIDSKKKSTLQYDLSLKVNNNGQIKSKGSLSHSPLKQNGFININRVSLKEFSPYVSESMYINIDDGYFSTKSKIKYEKSADKPDLELNGNLKIEELFVSDSRDNSSLFSFMTAKLMDFRLDLFPNSMYIDDAIFDAFYIDAQLDENKTINLSKLSKKQEDAKLKDINTEQDEPSNNFLFRLMKLKVTNGNAFFADYSLPINFQTSIHDLNGEVYAISTYPDEITYLDFDGEIDSYASTKLSGSIETSNIKSFLDINFNFRNLALNNMNGYSAQFAGYKIKNGKLFLDLGYKIYDSQLLGKNQIIVKNIELGEEIEDENITKLPLGFAIALLEDSNGVIDINMPVEGNLDEPDFKYGALLLKTFVNLIVKAVTSPFKFLGSALGIDGDDLQYAEFEAGFSKILPPQKEKLDNIAKIMIKKPKLSFSIIGSYSSVADTKVLQKYKLKNLVLKKSAGHAEMTVDVLEKIYLNKKDLKALNKLKTKIKKDFSKNMFNIEYQKALVEVSTTFQIVLEDELITLAKNRAKVLSTYMSEQKQIAKQRIILHEVIEANVDDKEWIKTILQIEVK